MVVPSRPRQDVNGRHVMHPDDVRARFAILAGMSMSICIFSALYAPHVGGVETYTRNLSHALALRGHDITIVTCHIDESPPYETQPDGVRVMRIPAVPLLAGRFPLVRPNAAAKRVRNELSSASLDAAIVNARFYPLSLAGASFAASLDVPTLAIEHGSAHLTLGSSALDHVIERVEHAMTDRFRKTAPHARWYGVSQASCTWLEHFGISAAGVFPNAIDAAAFRDRASHRSFRVELGLDERTPLVCFVGRLEPEKGVRQLVDTARLLTERGEQVHFALAGDGSLANVVRAADAANLHLLGPLDRCDVAALMLQADALCLPSRSEGFATVLLEAAACSCVPIATDVGGAREVIGDGEGGILLKDAEARTIADACSTIMHDRSKAAALASAARTHVERHCTWEATAYAVEKAIEAVSALP